MKYTLLTRIASLIRAIPDGSTELHRHVVAIYMGPEDLSGVRTDCPIIVWERGAASIGVSPDTLPYDLVAHVHRHFQEVFGLAYEHRESWVVAHATTEITVSDRVWGHTNCPQTPATS